MILRDLDIKIQYRSSSDDITRDFLIPTLKTAKIYKRAVGFFSSTSLIEASKGIYGLVENKGRIQIIASPKLSVEDLEAITKGYKARDEVIECALLREFYEHSGDFFNSERLNFVAKLVADGTMDVKIAFVEKEEGIGIYHEKIGIIEDENGDTIAFTGSMNETAQAFQENFESIMVFCSWSGGSDRQRAETLEQDFNNLWDNKTFKLHVIDFPQIAREKLLSYCHEGLCGNIDEQQFGKKGKLGIDGKCIELPVNLFDYQINAIKEWRKNSFRGIFDMATGTGKTFTALGGALHLLGECDGKLMIFIVCPFVHLVDQWAEDVRKCGIEPIVGHSGTFIKDWEHYLLRAFQRYLRSGTPFVCLTTNATFASDKVQKIISCIKPEHNTLLIIDEAHYFGARKLSNSLSPNIAFRLALSATLERHMDEEGTQLLKNYFGSKCIEYSLERAIREGRLVQYDYYPVLVSLDEQELIEYKRLTNKLRKYIHIDEKGRKSLSETGQMIVFQRARLVAGAKEKVLKLAEIMEDFKNDKYILVYCGATRGFGEYNSDETISRQIDDVQSTLGNGLGMSVHKFTSEESAQERNVLKKLFACGNYQALIAIRCLDEGVNIPDIRTAFILASSRNPKEYIQRRGRVLRIASGKEKAVIYDFVTLPHQLSEVNPIEFEDDLSLVCAEIERMKAFKESSLNPNYTDLVISKIERAYGLDQIRIDIKEWEVED